MTGSQPKSSQTVALIIYDGKAGPTATQMISFGKPFGGLAESPIEIVFGQHCSDKERVGSVFAACRPDLLVLSRFTSALGLEWIGLARRAGIPIIFHIDDDLLAVPASLGESKFKAYNSPERLEALRDNIEACDLVYVSTSPLADRFRQHGIATPIVAGDVYCAVAAEDVGALLPPATGPVIGYMGTGGHAADLAMIMPAVLKVMDTLPELQFEVFGTVKMPAELQRFGNRVRHIPPVAEYSDFLPYLRSLGWWVGLAPLEDNLFNRCKADTKWVEYSLAGMAVVASDLPVYHRACDGGAGKLAGTITEWTGAIRGLLLAPQKRTSMVDSAQRKLREIYSHERLRDQVITVFDEAGRISRKAPRSQSEAG